jgi:serine phosphatase RsbU (regulator of sigma subunit)
MSRLSPAASLRARVEQLHPMAIDVFLVVVVASAITTTISAAAEPGARDPDALAYVLGVVMSIPLLARRRWPVGVLLATAVVFNVYTQLDYPGFFPAVPLAVPLYAAASAGKLLWALGVSAIYVSGPLIYQLSVTSRPVARIVNDTLLNGAFFAAIVLLGLVIRGRRLYAAEAAERLRMAEAERERVAQELRVARLVQEQFLPSDLPELPGWRVAAFYRSAREVGGDFYNFIDLPGGKLGIAIGDVTDKGAPAALVMATTQGLLGAEAPSAKAPSALLEKMNDVLVLNTPERMFVTCQYIVLDPETGRLQFANAGHNLPYIAGQDGVADLKATGMPLGLLPGSTYEEKDAIVPRSARVLLHSDGLAEAHNGRDEMFGFPRIVEVLENSHSDDDLIAVLLAELDHFTGPEWEQEDDITLVTLERL